MRGLGILGGILGGLGAGAAGIVAIDKANREEALKQRALDLQERGQQAEVPLAFIPQSLQGQYAPGPNGTVRIDKTLAALYQAMRQRETEAEAGKVIGGVLADAERAAAPQMTPGHAPVPSMLDEDIAPTGQAGDTLVTPGTPPNPLALLGKILQVPGISGPQATLAQDYLKNALANDKPVAVPESGQLYDPRRREFITAPTTQAPFTPPEGYRPKPTVDKHGRVSTTYEPPPNERQDRTLAERLALAEERATANPRDAEAQADLARLKRAFANEEQLARARAEGATAGRPLDAATQQAMGVHNAILASIEQFKQFSPEEISAYVGLLQKPGQDVKLALQNLPVIGGAFGTPDQRYADFKALMGRLKGTAFGEGGKQLTPFEASVVFSYTPTGDEPGGAPAIAAKLKNLEAFTRIARAMRYKFATTAKGDLNPDEFDVLLRQEMKKAGLPGPGPAPRTTPSPQNGSPATKGSPGWGPARQVK